MLKKILAAAIAMALLVSLSATAMATPDDPVTVQPPATATVDPLINQVKAMRGEIKVLSALLKTEKKLQGEIKEILFVIKKDKVKVKATTEQLKKLTKDLLELNKQLRQLQKGGKKKTVDQAKVDLLKAAIQTAKDEIAKLQPLVDQMKGGNKYGNRAHKAVRGMLKPEYAELAPLEAEAKTLKTEINKLKESLEKALEAGDRTGAEALVLQIRAKVDLLKINLNARIEIYRGMRKILQDYKTSLLPAPDAPALESPAPSAATN